MLIIVIIITLLSIIYFSALSYLQKGISNIPGFIKRTNAQNKQSISVIVCARNEEKNLPGLIKALLLQNTKELEVEYIIVNDRSEDKTAELAEAVARENSSFKVIHIQERIAGFAPKKRAIDTAIQKAEGEIIILTDADGRPGNLWVKEIQAYFNKGVDMVIGYAPYIVNTNDGFLKKLLALEYFSIAAIAGATAGAGYPLTCVGTNMAYRKKMYQEIGGFGKYKAFISGDDDLFLTRVRESAKYKIIYAAGNETQVFNNPPKSFKQFFNQRLRYASKGFNYPLKVTITLSVYVIYNLSIFSGVGLLWADNNSIFWIWLSLIALKSYFEYSFLSKAAEIIGDKRFIKYYPLAAFLHVPYVLFFGIFGQFKFFKWAEGTMEHGISTKELK